MSLFKKIFIWTAISIVAGVLIFVVTTEVTSQPSFCSSCHYMESYVEAWKASSHGDVTCTDCHFPPGYLNKLKGKFSAVSMAVNYMTGVYKRGKPHADIEDASCLRSGCHEQRLLEGETIYKQDISFNHTSHLSELRRGKKLKCTSCHSQIVQGEHMTVTETTCFLCHFKNQPDEVPINDCNWCHEAPTSELDSYDHTMILERDIDCSKCHGTMQLGEGNVPRERCSMCHSEWGKLEKYNDPEFIHKYHVTEHKVECQNCHDLIDHKSISKTTGIMPGCEACHSETHQAQMGLFSGTAGMDIPPNPDHMFEAGLTCQGCHMWSQNVSDIPEFGHTSIAKGESCELCHFEGEFDKRITQWQTVMKEKIILVEKMIETVEKEIHVYSKTNEVTEEIEKMLLGAKHNFQAVKLGNVVHNVTYSDELLQGAYETLNQILVKIKSSVLPPQFSTYSEKIPSECKSCHYGQEEVTVEAFDIQFSHNIHVGQNEIDCLKCHSNEVSHGQTIITRSECLNCHHSNEQNECSKCHSIQEQFYDGSIAITSEQLPDVMYDAEIECNECHMNDEDRISKSGIKVCADCHEDDEYYDLAVEWKTETHELLSDIQEKLIQSEKVELTQEQKLIVNKIRLGVGFILEDKSSSVHNNELISTLLSDYIDALNEIMP